MEYISHMNVSLCFEGVSAQNSVSSKLGMVQTEIIFCTRKRSLQLDVGSLESFYKKELLEEGYF